MCLYIVVNKLKLIILTKLFTIIMHLIINKDNEIYFSYSYK